MQSLAIIVALVLLSACTATETIPSTEQAVSITFHMSDVTAHNGRESCWTIVNGAVYDVTNYIDQHPGGPQKVQEMCGTDGSAAFAKKHGGKAMPEATLEEYRIGMLA